MFPRGQYPIYSFSDDMRREKLEDSGFNEEQMKESVKIISDWFKKQPHLVDAGIDKMEKLITSPKTKELLIDACKLVSDENKRPKLEHNDDCLLGTFKKLNID